MTILGFTFSDAGAVAVVVVGALVLLALWLVWSSLSRPRGW